MKKNLLFLAAAALTLASCSSDETTAVNESEVNTINFRPLTNNVTRATSLIIDDLESDGFKVTGTYTTGHASYFADQLFKKHSTSWEPYTTDFIKIYWPSDDADILDFHAYAPASSAQLSVSNSNVSTLNGCPEYTVTPASAAASQVDFIYATLTGQDHDNTSMALAFGHKESQVSIKLKNTDSGLKFTVDEIALCNISASGVYKNRDASATTTTTMGWGDFGSPVSYAQGSLSVVQDGITDAALVGTSWILIPHQLAVPTTDSQYASGDDNANYGGAYIRVKLKAQSTANSEVYYAGSSSDYVYAIWPISTNASTTTWAEGYHYTYTIDLAGGGYYETNKASSSAALDRVLDLNTITFATVSVSAWTTSDSNVTM